MDDLRAGTRTLAEFVTATIGRKGSSRPVHGGYAVASTYNVQNAYFTTAIRTDLEADPAVFLADVLAFFGPLNRAFKIWVPTDDPALHAALLATGAKPETAQPPAMSIRNRIPSAASRFDIRVARSPEEFDQFGQMAEAGYASPRLGWLLRDQDSYGADGALWATAFDGDTPVGAACGFLNGATGGIYFVATPPEHRGKGVGAEITRWVANTLFDRGADCVTLQSSEAGFRVYERLGFSVCGHYARFDMAPAAK
jgi:ribosomal protein S18 acetylase RimI-like enzyme